MNFLKRFAFAFKQASQVQGTISVMFGKGGGGFTGGRVKFRDAVEKGYQSLIWVHRCVSKNAESIASVPWRAYKPKKNGEFVPTPGHPAELLMSAPNPYMDGKEFISAWSIFMQLAGKAFWEIVYVQGKPFHLYPLRPDWVKPDPDPNNFISGYTFDTGGSGKKVPFKPEDIMWFRYLDPLNPYDGLSPITAAARTIDTENAAVMWNKTVFDNAAVPGGVLTVPATTLERDKRDRLQEDLESQFTQENMHRPLVLWGGMDWKQMSLSQQDMEWLKQRQLNKFELCAILGVPPAVVGANEDPTYSNYSVARLAHWEDTIIPQLEWLQTKINMQLTPLFKDGVVLRYDISDVPAMRESFQQKVATATSLYAMGVPFNEVNKKLKLGLSSLAWGDVWWAPAMLTPVDGSNISPGDGNPAEGAPAPGTLPSGPKPKPNSGDEEPTPDEQDPLTGDQLERE